jgi:hypothetical protein
MVDSGDFYCYFFILFLIWEFSFPDSISDVEVLFLYSNSDEEFPFPYSISDKGISIPLFYFR